jgi:organic hydroperoxide reductase OsmC/OhrA
MGQVQVVVEQVGLSTSKGTARTHTVFIDRPTAKGGATFTLNVSATCHDRELLSKLVTIAERACIVSNTLKEVGPISIVLEAASAGETVNA